jgi:hypothetical protein
MILDKPPKMFKEIFDMTPRKRVTKYGRLTTAFNFVYSLYRIRYTITNFTLYKAFSSYFREAPRNSFTLPNVGIVESSKDGQ